MSKPQSPLEATPTPKKDVSLDVKSPEAIELEKEPEFTKAIARYRKSLTETGEFSIEDYQKINETIQEFARTKLEEYYKIKSKLKSDPAFIEWRMKFYHEYNSLKDPVTSLIDLSVKKNAKSWLALSDIFETREFQEIQGIYSSIELERHGQTILSDKTGSGAEATPEDIILKYKDLELKFAEVTGKIGTKEAKKAVSDFERDIISVFTALPDYKAPSKESKSKVKEIDDKEFDEVEVAKQLSAAKVEEMAMLDKEKPQMLAAVDDNLATDDTEKETAREKIESEIERYKALIQRSLDLQAHQIVASKQIRELEARYKAFKLLEIEKNYLHERLKSWSGILFEHGFRKLEENLLNGKEYKAMRERILIDQKDIHKSYNIVRNLSSAPDELIGPGYIKVLRVDYDWLEEMSAIELIENEKIKKEKIKELVEKIQQFQDREFRKFNQILAKLSLMPKEDSASRKILLEETGKISTRMQYLLGKMDSAKSFIDENYKKSEKDKALAICNQAAQKFTQLKDKALELAYPNAPTVALLSRISQVINVIQPEIKKRRTPEGQRETFETFKKILGDTELNPDKFPLFVIIEYITTAKPLKAFNEAGGLNEMAPKIIKARKDKLKREEEEFESKKGKDGDLVEASNQVILEKIKSAAPKFAKFSEDIVNTCDYFKVIIADGSIGTLLTSEERKEKKKEKLPKSESAAVAKASLEPIKDEEKKKPLEVSVVPDKYPAKAGAKKEWVLGDIHGDLNALLTALLVSGVASFKAGEESVAIFDTVTGEKVSAYPAGLSAEQIRERYRTIPNLQFNQDFNDRITFLGDILDRGVYSDECLYTLIDLCQQEKNLYKDQKEEKEESSQLSSYAKNRKLNWIFADHELYGLCKEVPFIPSYLQIGTTARSPIAQLQRGRDFGLQSASANIRKALKEEFITYGHIGTNGVIYSHSFYTKECFEAILKQINNDKPLESLNANEKISRAGRSAEELAKVATAMNEWLELEKLSDKNTIDYTGEKFQTMAGIVIDHFNKVLKFAAENPDIYYDTLKLTDNDKVDSNNPLFTFDEHSPIATRGIPLPGIMAVGHTAQRKDFSLKHLSNADGLGEEDQLKIKILKKLPYPIWVYDCGNSYMYDRGDISHPTAFCIEPDGSISGTRFIDEELIFIGGAINPKVLKPKDKEPSSSPISSSSSQIGSQSSGEKEI